MINQTIVILTDLLGQLEILKTIRHMLYITETATQNLIELQLKDLMGLGILVYCSFHILIHQDCAS